MIYISILRRAKRYLLSDTTSTKMICDTFSKRPTSRGNEELAPLPYTCKEVNFMLYTYTAVITELDGVFYASVPDINGCVTTAKSLSEAIALITDALNLSLVVLEDENIKPAATTPQANIPHEPSDTLTIIQADTIKYRSMTDSRAVRKNVSLPAWMSRLADQRGINCSKVLQDALLNVLS